jgi:hypothetical protein
MSKKMGGNMQDSIHENTSLGDEKGLSVDSGDGVKSNCAQMFGLRTDYSLVLIAFMFRTSSDRRVWLSLSGPT